MIEIRGIEKSFGPLQVLKGVDLDVRSGEVISIIGPSGTGKSTFLRCVNYLETPDRGTISFDDGQTFDFSRLEKGAVRELRSHSSMVFQNFSLFAMRRRSRAVNSSRCCCGESSSERESRKIFIAY